MSPNSQFQMRIAVRTALETSGEEASEALRRCHDEWPEMVEAVLESERLARPREVALLRKSLGLSVSPYRKLAEEILRQWYSLGEQADRIFFAAELLEGPLPVLSAEVVALASLEKARPLVVAMHAVAPLGKLRAQLGRVLSDYCDPDTTTCSSIAINRDCSAFYQGFLVDNQLVMIFREYPGHYLVFSMVLGEGVESIAVTPVAGEHWIERVLSSRNPNHTQAHSLDDCRTLLAASIARLEDKEASEQWRILGHLVEERLFPLAETDVGFVVGDQGARTLLDRLARAFLEDDMSALDSLFHSESAAAVLFELFGPKAIRILLGLNHGVERLDIGVESIDSRRARALMIGRTGVGQVLTRTRIFLVTSGQDWEIERLEVLGVGPADEMFGPVWDVLSGQKMLPVQHFGDLSAAEQEIVAGFLDTGFRLDETASAISLLRKAELVASPGSIAAACHFVFERLYSGNEPMSLETNWDEILTRLCDRYEGGLDEAADLVEQLETRLISRSTYKQYLVG